LHAAATDSRTVVPHHALARSANAGKVFFALDEGAHLTRGARPAHAFADDE
jgi:hypothetical protein